MAAPHSPTVSRTSSTAPLVGANHVQSAPVAGGLQPSATVAAVNRTAQSFLAENRRQLCSWAEKNPRSAEKAAHVAFAATASLSLPLIVLGAATSFTGIGVVLIVAGILSGAAAVKAEMAHLQMQKHPDLAERNYLGHDPHKPSKNKKADGGGFCQRLLSPAANAFDEARKAREEHLKTQPGYDKTKPFAHNGFELWTQPGQFDPQSIKRESWLTWDLDPSQDNTPLEALLSRSTAVVKTEFMLVDQNDPRYQRFHSPEPQQRILNHTVAQIRQIVLQKAMHHMPEALQQKIQDKTKELHLAQADKPKKEQLSPQHLQQQAMDAVIDAEYPQLSAENLLQSLKKRLGLPESSENAKNDKKSGKSSFDAEYAFPGDANSENGFIGTTVHSETV